MARRPTRPLLVALACLIALAATAVLALGSSRAMVRDAAMLHGFMSVDRPHLHGAMVALAHLADPVPYLVIGVGLIGWALLRGLRWRAGAVAALLLITGASTQAVKHLLATDRLEPWLGTHQIGSTAWPSGHSTAAMTLALCAVLVAPVGLRPAMAVVGGAFAAGVGYAVIVLAWHFPSDVLGGFLMAGMWTSLAVAALRVVEPARERARCEPAALGLALVAALGVALAAAAAAAARPATVALYAAERPMLVLGAVVIAGLSGLLAAGLARAA